jgi:ankyrin repeat protein
MIARMTSSPGCRRPARTVVTALVLAIGLLHGCGKPEPPTINLYLALQRGDLHQFERHLAWGTDVNAPLPDGRTPLQMAAADGREAFVRQLLDHGVDPLATGPDGHTALETALLNGRVQLAPLLVPRGAKLDASGLLLLMARHGTADRDVIGFLLQRGADLEARDAAGDTALLVAVRRNDRVMVRHLLDRGADPFVADAGGRSALATAETLKHEDVARLLRRQGAVTPAH